MVICFLRDSWIDIFWYSQERIKIKTELAIGISYWAEDKGTLRSHLSKCEWWAPTCWTKPWVSVWSGFCKAFLRLRIILIQFYEMLHKFTMWCKLRQQGLILDKFKCLDANTGRPVNEVKQADLASMSLISIHLLKPCLVISLKVQIFDFYRSWKI